MSRRRYRAIDLLILALFMVLLEALCLWALNFFPGEVYTLSVILPMTLLVMMRWGAWGLLHAALGGAVYSVMLGGDLRLVALYTLGNLGAALCLIWFRKPGKAAVQASWPLTALYALTGWLGMSLGRTLMALILQSETPLFLLYFTTDALTAAISVIVLSIARKQNGLFEDQAAYLIRLASEEELSRGQ